MSTVTISQSGTYFTDADLRGKDDKMFFHIDADGNPIKVGVKLLDDWDK